jgi:phosphohistidine phosphatase
VYNTNLMIVGHLPFLAYLTSLLVSGNDAADAIAFDAGAVACLCRSDPGRWQIEWMITPKILP